MQLLRKRASRRFSPSVPHVCALPLTTSHPHSPNSPPAREYPAFVERYIATTSDMFRHFIDTGLAQLAAAEAAGGGAAPAARSSSSGESWGSAGGAAPAAPAAQQQQQQQQQQQHAEPLARRPSPVPPLALQRPPLSPPVTSPSGDGGAAVTPGGTVYSPSNPRFASMRERLEAMRLSSEGSVGAGAGAAPAAGSLPTSGRSTDEAALARMGNSLQVCGVGLHAGAACPAPACGIADHANASLGLPVQQPIRFEYHQHIFNVRGHSTSFIFGLQSLQQRLADLKSRRTSDQG